MGPGKEHELPRDEQLAYHPSYHRFLETIQPRVELLQRFIIVLKRGGERCLYHSASWRNDRGLQVSDDDMKT